MISGEELTQMANNIGSQAAVYGMHLGLKTYAPQIEQVLKDLRNLQMELNQFGIGHCKATQGLFAAALPQNTAMYETVCEEMQGGSGYDLGGQRKKCKDFQQQKEAAEKAQKKDKELLLDNYNLFIEAAKKSGLSKNEYSPLMSMVGTIVVKEGVMIPYPALAKDEKSWNAHIKGGEGAAQYECNDKEKCLVVTIKENVNISEKESYNGKVKDKLNAIKDKLIKQEYELDETEKGFIGSIGNAFPIFDHITLEAISGITILDSSSEIVARYMLLSHLKETIGIIKKNIATLKQKQINTKYLTEYEKDLDKLLKYAGTKWFEVMTDSDRINKRAMLIEKHLIVRERG